MRTFILPIIGYVIFSLQLPSSALPGDTIGTAVRRLNSNTLSRNTKFSGQPLGSNTFASYENTSKVFYGNHKLNITIHLPKNSARATNDLAESFSIENSLVGHNLLNQKDYNIRQDKDVLSIVKGLWGDKVYQDFQQSRFTNKSKNTFPPERSIRALYKGKSFCYETIYMTEDSTMSKSAYVTSRFSFTVYSLQDWKILILPESRE
jgi:hypothetical protein